MRFIIFELLSDEFLLQLYGNFGPRDGEPMKKATKIVFEHSDDEC